MNFLFVIIWSIDSPLTIEPKSVSLEFWAVVLENLYNDLFFRDKCLDLVLFKELLPADFIFLTSNTQEIWINNNISIPLLQCNYYLLIEELNALQHMLTIIEGTDSEIIFKQALIDMVNNLSNNTFSMPEVPQTVAELRTELSATKEALAAEHKLCLSHRWSADFQLSLLIGLTALILILGALGTGGGRLM